MNYSHLRKDLKEKYSVTDLTIYQFTNWHHGACYFTGRVDGRKIFIKSDYEFGLLLNEIRSYEALKKIDKMNRHLLEPLFYDYKNNKFIAYQYVEALNLYDHYDSQELDLKSFRVIVAQLINILDSLYQAGIVYRDLKMDNIFVMKDDSILLIDFLFSIYPDRIGSLIELDRGSIRNLKILENMGVPSQKEKYVWDDAYGMERILEKLIHRCDLCTHEELKEVGERVGRIEYHL